MKKRKRKSKAISYWKGEAVGNFKNTANIQPKKLSSDQRRRVILTVLNYLKDDLFNQENIAPDWVSISFTANN